MAPTTRRAAAAAQGNTGNEDPPQGSQQESARGSGRGSQGVRTSNVARADEDHPPSAVDRNVVQPLSTAASPTLSLSNTSRDHQSDGLQQVTPAPTNLIRNTPFGEPFPQFQRPAPPQPSPNPTDSSAQQTRPPPNPPHFHQPRCPPHHSTKHAKPPRTRLRKYESRPRNLSKIGLKKAMELHTTRERRNAYNRFREHVRFAMKQCGKGVWIDFDNVPKRFSDWLVDEVRDDPHIPFMDEYGRWAVLDAARGIAGTWRKDLYRRRLREVPENRRYLAANSAKRNPDAPRGARYPARSSKRNQTPTLDYDDNSDGNDTEDERVPILPPGPSTMTDSVGFSNFRGDSWDPVPLSNYPAHLTSSASQPPFGDSGQPSQAQAPLIPYTQPNFPLSGAPNSTQYWMDPPPFPPISGYPQMQNEDRNLQQQQDSASGILNQAPLQPLGPEGLGHGTLPGYPSMWNNVPTPWSYGQPNANGATNQRQAENNSRFLLPTQSRSNTNGRRHQAARARDPNNPDYAVQPIPKPRPSHSPQGSSSVLHRFAPPPTQLQFIQFVPGNSNVNEDNNNSNNDRDGGDGSGSGHGNDSYGYDSDNSSGCNNNSYDGSDDGSNSRRRRRGRSPPPGG